MKNLKKLFPIFFKNWLPILSIILIVFSFFWRVFIFKEVPLPGDFVVGVYYPWLDYKWGYPAGVPVKNPIMADVVSFTYPMRILATDLLKNGNLPLWNPHILMGVPLLANFQSAPFSPTNIFYLIFDKLTAWSFQIIFQHLLAIIFTYLLLRNWKISKSGSLLGGIIYAFSGFNVIWSQWNAHALVAAFLPILILSADKVLKENKYLFGIILSIIISLQIFSGYPQLVFYSLLSVGLLWLIRIIRTKNKLFHTLFLGIFIILGVGLAGVQLVPGAELLSFSQRAIEYHPFDWAFLPMVKIITFVSADFFGNHATYNYWGPQDYTSNTGFVGVVAILLASLSLFKIKEKKEIQYLSIVGLFSLLLSFPTPLSIFLWKSGIFGFNAAAAHRSLVLFCFSIALLSGFGFDYLPKISIKEKLTSIFLVLITISIFAIYAFNIHQTVGLRNLIIPASILFLSSIILIKTKLKPLLISIAIFELFYFGWKFTPFSPRNLIFPQTPILEFLENQKKPFRTTGDHVIPINLRMVYGIDTVEGYDAIYPANSSKIIQLINNGGDFRRYAIIDNDTSPLLNLVNTKYILALTSDPNLKRFDNQRFSKVFQDKSVIVYENKDALPRAFMVYNWKMGGTFDELFQKDFSLGKQIILDQNPNISKENKKPIQNQVRYAFYESTKNEIQVQTDKEGLLFISDTYYPGWHAFIDNNETKIYKANFTFRAIEIPKGKHSVKMVYEPESFKKGLVISLISFGLLILLGLLIIGKQILQSYT